MPTHEMSRPPVPDQRLYELELFERSRELVVLSIPGFEGKPWVVGRGLEVRKGETLDEHGERSW
jgi:hypothetical protein